MTKEQEQALNHLKRLVACRIYPDDVNAMMVAIQAIKDLDKMNGIALDLASENDDLIEKLDSIRTEIEEQVLESLSDGGDDWFAVEKVNDCLEIIDKYREESKDADSN